MVEKELNRWGEMPVVSCGFSASAACEFLRPSGSHEKGGTAPDFTDRFLADLHAVQRADERRMLCTGLTGRTGYTP
jgi:hypothetical protein